MAGTRCLTRSFGALDRLRDLDLLFDLDLELRDSPPSELLVLDTEPEKDEARDRDVVARLLLPVLLRDLLRDLVFEVVFEFDADRRLRRFTLTRFFAIVAAVRQDRTGEKDATPTRTRGERVGIKK